MGPIKNLIQRPPLSPPHHHHHSHHHHYEAVWPHQVLGKVDYLSYCLPIHTSIIWALARYMQSTWGLPHKSFLTEPAPAACIRVWFGINCRYIPSASLRSIEVKWRNKFWWRLCLYLFPRSNYFIVYRCCLVGCLKWGQARLYNHCCHWKQIPLHFQLDKYLQIKILNSVWSSLNEGRINI